MARSVPPLCALLLFQLWIDAILAAVLSAACFIGCGVGGGREALSASGNQGVR